MVRMEFCRLQIPNFKNGGWISHIYIYEENLLFGKGGHFRLRPCVEVFLWLRHEKGLLLYPRLWAVFWMPVALFTRSVLQKGTQHFASDLRMWRASRVNLAYTSTLSRPMSRKLYAHNLRTTLACVSCKCCARGSNAQQRDLLPWAMEVLLILLMQTARGRESNPDLPRHAFYHWAKSPDGTRLIHRYAPRLRAECALSVMNYS
jgi:hypothetical protein